MTRRTPSPGIALAILLFSAACTAQQEPMAEGRGPASETAAAPGGAERAESGESPAPSRRKLVRTVDLEVRVEDPERAAAEVTLLAEESGGYVSSRTVQPLGSFPSYYLTLRIPVDDLDRILEAVRRLAVEVVRETQRSEDVTDRFVDLGARLRALEATEVELLALLSESRSRGHGAQDIMAIYHELTGVRTQIEQIRGQLNLLENRTALSTLELSIRPTEAATPVVADAWRPLETVRRSARILLSTLRGLANLVIYLVVVALPVGILIAGPLWLLGRLVRQRRRRVPTGPADRKGRAGTEES